MNMTDLDWLSGLARRIADGTGEDQDHEIVETMTATTAAAFAGLLLFHGGNAAFADNMVQVARLRVSFEAALAAEPKEWKHSKASLQ